MAHSDRLVNTLLVVDDSNINQVLLENLLKDLVVEFIFASNGVDAIKLYEERAPDMILMDINMPVLDGIEATRRIKSIDDRFCPIIFITGSTEEDIILKCVEAGGDDFVPKPFSKAMVEAKVKSMSRFSQLYHEASKLNSIIEQETKLAETIFSDAVMLPNVGLESIDLIQMPASRFSGDVLLSSYRPNGDLHILLGDFTGHGLSAAIGALPVSDIFRSMTRKGFSSLDIIAQINRKLFGLLPTGMFLALGFVTLSVREQTVDIQNFGLPDIWVFGQDTQHYKACISSSHPALGILDEINIERLSQRIMLDIGDQIVMSSDGVMEAMNSEHRMFGEDAFLASCLQGINNEGITHQLLNDLANFCSDFSQKDDISFFVIPCIKALIPSNLVQPSVGLSGNALSQPKAEEHWQWSMALSGSEILKINPVPLALNHLKEMEGEKDHWQSVYTILSELYVNAIDHGVLRLNSSMKSTPDGFCEYFVEREKRLNALDKGNIAVDMLYQRTEMAGLLTINIKDSGDGFDYHTVNTQYSNDKARDIINTDMCGRGVELVSKLCDELEYIENGTRVLATYRIA